MKRKFSVVFLSLLMIFSLPVGLGFAAGDATATPNTNRQLTQAPGISEEVLEHPDWAPTMNRVRQTVDVAPLEGIDINEMDPELNDKLEAADESFLNYLAEMNN